MRDTAHPYGVQPEGNRWTSSQKSCRGAGLGAISRLNDELALSVLGLADIGALGCLASVSRAMYAFVHHADLWKALALEAAFAQPEATAAPLPLRPTWRETVRAQAGAEGRGPPHRPIAVRGLFSDILFQPHFVATLPIPPAWTALDNVERHANMTLAEFARYDALNRPVVLTDATAGWHDFLGDGGGAWTEERLLHDYGNILFHAGGVEVSLADFWRYATETADDMPLCIFDKRFADKAPDIAAAYAAPAPIPGDLLATLGEAARPDWRWMIIGGRRSGSSFHVDPNGTSAFNVIISGSKKWVLFPPGATPPGVHASVDGLDLATPVSVVEWFNEFYEQAAAAPVPPVEAVVRAGEAMFVPRGWWHCVLNLDMPTLAITHNFCSHVSLPHVLRFLLTKPALVSGVPPAMRVDLGERFAAALRVAHPELTETVDAVEAAARARRARLAAFGTGSSSSEAQRRRRGRERQVGLTAPLSSMTAAPEKTPKTEVDGERLTLPIVKESSIDGGDDGGSFSFGFSF